MTVARQADDPGRAVGYERDAHESSASSRIADSSALPRRSSSFPVEQPVGLLREMPSGGRLDAPRQVFGIVQRDYEARLRWIPDALRAMAVPPADGHVHAPSVKRTVDENGACAAPRHGRDKVVNGFEDARFRGWINRVHGNLHVPRSIIADGRLCRKVSQRARAGRTKRLNPLPPRADYTAHLSPQ